MELPKGKIGYPSWSADGKKFAFTETLDTGIGLWIADAFTGKLVKFRA